MNNRDPGVLQMASTGDVLNHHLKCFGEGVVRNAPAVRNGDYAYILWSAETVDNVYEAATDMFVIRNGKIVAQSFAAKITPKS